MVLLLREFWLLLRAMCCYLGLWVRAMVGCMVWGMARAMIGLWSRYG